MNELKIFDDLDGVDPGDDLARRLPVTSSASSGKPDPAGNAVIGLIAAAAGIGVVVADCSPTGWRPADVVMSFLLGALVSIATAKARRWSWFVLAALAALVAESTEMLVAAVAMVATTLLGMALPRSRARFAGAVVGALAVQILVRIPDRWFLGASALWATVAILPVLVSAYRRSRSRTRRAVRLSVYAIGGLTLLACIGFGIAALAVRSKMVDAGNLAKSGFESARAGRQDEAIKSFKEADAAFTDASTMLNGVWARPARAVPVVGAQASAAEAIAASGQDLSHTAVEAAGTARYDELRTKNGLVNLELLASMKQPVRNTQDALDRAHGRLAAVESPWLLPPLADPLAELRGEVDRARVDAALASDAVAAAPALLGADRPKNYLILFANTAESRYLGGFVAAYGELSASNGKLTLVRSGRIAELSEAPGAEARQLSGPNEFVERYGRLFPQRYFQNVTASPDFETDAAVVRELYPKAGGAPIDGVIYVDPFGLAALLRLTGPITIEGSAQPLTADNAAMYLLRDQYVSLPDVDDRSDVLAKASKATFEALTTRELPGPRAIGDALGPAVREGRLHAVTFDDQGRALLDRLGAVKTFPHGGPGTGDFLSVRSSNSNPNKIDSFLQRDITYEATVDQRSGEVSATASVVFANDAPGALLPPYIIGNESRAGQETAPLGTNTMFVSIYSNLDLQGATYDGAPVPIAAQTELGHNVYSLPIRVPPKARGTLVLQLKGAPTSSDPTAGYQLAVSPQPMVNPDRVTIRVRPGTDQRVLSADGLTAGSDGATVTYNASELRRFGATVGPP